KDGVAPHRRVAAGRQRPNRVDVHLTPPADQRHETGQRAALDVACHHLVHAAEPRSRQSSTHDLLTPSWLIRRTWCPPWSLPPPCIQSLDGMIGRSKSQRVWLNDSPLPKPKAVVGITSYTRARLPPAPAKAPSRTVKRNGASYFDAYVSATRWSLT